MTNEPSVTRNQSFPFNTTFNPPGKLLQVKYKITSRSKLRHQIVGESLVAGNYNLPSKSRPRRLATYSFETHNDSIFWDKIPPGPSLAASTIGARVRCLKGSTSDKYATTHPKGWVGGLCPIPVSNRFVLHDFRLHSQFPVLFYELRRCSSLVR